MVVLHRIGFVGFGSKKEYGEYQRFPNVTVSF